MIIGRLCSYRMNRDHTIYYCLSSFYKVLWLLMFFLCKGQRQGDEEKSETRGKTKEKSRGEKGQGNTRGEVGQKTGDEVSKNCICPAICFYHVTFIMAHTLPPPPHFVSGTSLSFLVILMKPIPSEMPTSPSSLRGGKRARRNILEHQPRDNLRRSTKKTLGRS